MPKTKKRKLGKAPSREEVAPSARRRTSSGRTSSGCRCASPLLAAVARSCGALEGALRAPPWPARRCPPRARVLLRLRLLRVSHPELAALRLPGAFCSSTFSAGGDRPRRLVPAAHGGAAGAQRRPRRADPERVPPREGLPRPPLRRQAPALPRAPRRDARRRRITSAPPAWSTLGAGGRRPQLRGMLVLDRGRRSRGATDPIARRRRIRHSSKAAAAQIL